MCGRSRKISNSGTVFGWSATSFCTVESFFDECVFEEAGNLTRNEAISKITDRVLKLNPNADNKKIKKFILNLRM